MTPIPLAPGCLSSHPVHGPAHSLSHSLPYRTVSTQTESKNAPIKNVSSQQHKSQNRIDIHMSVQVGWEWGFYIQKRTTHTHLRSNINTNSNPSIHLGPWDTPPFFFGVRKHSSVFSGSGSKSRGRIIIIIIIIIISPLVLKCISVTSVKPFPVTYTGSLSLILCLSLCLCL